MKPSHKLMTRYATSIAAANAAAAVAASHHPSNHLSNHSIATSRHHHSHQLNQINHHLNLHHHHPVDSDEQEEEEFEEDVEEDDVPIDLSVKSRTTTRSLPVIVRPEDHYDHHKIPLFRSSVTPSGAGGREAIHEQPQHHSHHHHQQQQQDIINEFAVRYMFLNQSLGGANGVIAAAAASRHPALQSLLPTIAALSHHFPPTVTEDDLRGSGGWPVSDGRRGSLHSIPHVLRENIRSIQHEELDEDGMESPSPPIGDSTPNSSFASIGGGPEGLITDRKKMSRPLTGRYVRHGTGASPSTLMSLRRMIEERQKRRTSPSAKGNVKRNSKGRNNNVRRK